MKHPNGKDIFPEKLLKQIQKYVSGRSVYIPAKETRRSWGEASGYKRQIEKRNREIKTKFQNGSSVFALSEEYFLSVESIKRIVYSKKGERTVSNDQNFEIQKDALVKYIGSSASVVIPSEVKSIEKEAFARAVHLEAVTIPDSVRRIGIGAFKGCTALSRISLPVHITDIGSGTFQDCTQLSELEIPASVCLIGYGAFRGCRSLSLITLPENLSDIGCNTFRDCVALAEITVPDRVTVIGYSAFHGCRNLVQVTVPASVVSLGRGVFAGCEKLTRITYRGTCAEWEKIDKSSQWDLGMPQYTVVCTDGLIE
ncbi:MAG: leucine-rich repeat protein [Clostridia bacterium]|nr:leucine-rich repeat protein [Clostridia bacterium]